MNKNKIIFIVITTIYLLNSLTTRSEDIKEVRVAVLKFGSVNWELDVIKHHNLALSNNLNIKKIEMTNKDAAAIAFLSKAADIFITDWIWASKQRTSGNFVKFSPYSSAAGALMVKNQSIKNIKDLKNKKVGIAGGSLDKSWLFFRAYSIKKYNLDPLKFFNSSFAAPPLINGLLRNNELDAGFNYWNYSARLEASGYKKLISVEEILPYIGIKGELPLIGYVFREEFEIENTKLLRDFIKASYKAREILKKSDKEWERISNMTGAENKEMLIKIRDNFRKGIPSQNYKDMENNMMYAYKVLAEIGGRSLVGKSRNLASGIFWVQ